MEQEKINRFLFYALTGMVSIGVIITISLLLIYMHNK